MNVLARAAERRCLTATMTTGPTLHSGPILTPSAGALILSSSVRGFFSGGER